MLRSGDAWLCLSAGPNGQGGTGGHAHNDKNSVELSFGSLDVVADRGTYVYARDPQERNARRGTTGHSTVQVDGLEQNRIVPGRLFALPDTARARIRRLEHREGFEIAAGEHRGYERAGVLRDQIQSLKKVLERQKIISTEEVDQDVIGVVRQGADAAVELFFVRKGRLVGQEAFFFDKVAGWSDGEILSAFVR